jgi:hypothetical protein
MECGSTRWVVQGLAVASSFGSPLVGDSHQSEQLQLVAAIVTSYTHVVGGHLIPPESVDIVEALMNAPLVVLCHDGGSDPRFIYANVSAAHLWRLDLHEMIGMPSRLSAPPESRAERSRMLARAARDGIVRRYAGERVASDGTRFVIEGATLWNVDLPEGGTGQAVAFDSFYELPS